MQRNKTKTYTKNLTDVSIAGFKCHSDTLFLDSRPDSGVLRRIAGKSEQANLKAQRAGNNRSHSIKEKRVKQKWTSTKSVTTPTIHCFMRATYRSSGCNLAAHYALRLNHIAASSFCKHLSRARRNRSSPRSNSCMRLAKVVCICIPHSTYMCSYADPVGAITYCLVAWTAGHKLQLRCRKWRLGLLSLVWSSLIIDTGTLTKAHLSLPFLQSGLP